MFVFNVMYETKHMKTKCMRSIHVNIHGKGLLAQKLFMKTYCMKYFDTNFAIYGSYVCNTYECHNIIMYNIPPLT